jgi:hypothetical protein
MSYTASWSIVNSSGTPNMTTNRTTIPVIVPQVRYDDLFLATDFPRFFEPPSLDDCKARLPVLDCRRFVTSIHGRMDFVTGLQTRGSRSLSVAMVAMKAFRSSSGCGMPDAVMLNLKMVKQ